MKRHFNARAHELAQENTPAARAVVPLGKVFQGVAGKVFAGDDDIHRFGREIQELAIIHFRSEGFAHLHHRFAAPRDRQHLSFANNSGRLGVDDVAIRPDALHENSKGRESGFHFGHRFVPESAIGGNPVGAHDQFLIR